MGHKRILTWWALLTPLILFLSALSDADTYAQDGTQVGLVVQFGDGSTMTRCVTFSESEISGYDVLDRSGLKIAFSQSSGLGLAVCQIEDEGCPSQDCFCGCKGSTCTYWSYWHIQNGSWAYSPIGAGSTKVHHGDVEGWHWSIEGPPDPITFEQICAPTSPTNTPPPPPASSTPTPIPLPPTRTSSPTNTPTHPPASSTPTPIPLSPTRTSSPATAVPSPTQTSTLVAPTATSQQIPTMTSLLVTTTPSQSPTKRPTAKQQTPVGVPVASYVSFGLIVSALGALLVLVIRRR